jgi:hypothetical protein
MLFDTVDEDDFPDINETTTTEPLSAYGENKEIQDESNTVEDYSDIDTSYYGYDTLE